MYSHNSSLPDGAEIVSGRSEGLYQQLMAPRLGENEYFHYTESDIIDMQRSAKG